MARTRSKAKAELTWPVGGSSRAGSAKEWVDALAGCSLFAGVSKRHLRKIAGLAKVVEFTPGEIVAQHGEPGDAFYLVLHGRARVLGERKAHSSLGPGGFFGEIALLDGGPRTATVTAGTQLVALKIPRQPFLKLLEQEPRVAVAILQEVAARLRKVERAQARSR